MPKDQSKTKSPAGSSAAGGSEDGWIDAKENPPEHYEWPIIAYFGIACKGCKGPCVMLNNWNDTFTHWQRLDARALQKALDSIPMPNPPNEKLTDHHPR